MSESLFSGGDAVWGEVKGLVAAIGFGPVFPTGCRDVDKSPDKLGK